MTICKPRSRTITACWRRRHPERIAASHSHPSIVKDNGPLSSRYHLDLVQLWPELACDEQSTRGGVERDPVEDRLGVALIDGRQ